MTKRKAPPISDAEEAKIQAQIATDPDDFEPTDEELTNARSFAEVFPNLAKRPGPPKTKEAVSIRLDIDLLEQLRAKGAGWQSRVNALLRKHLEEV
jgi:uncharacterized protein (DUF4415 family)